MKFVLLFWYGVIVCAIFVAYSIFGIASDKIINEYNFEYLQCEIAVKNPYPGLVSQATMCQAFVDCSEAEDGNHPFINCFTQRLAIDLSKTKG